MAAPPTVLVVNDHPSMQELLNAFPAGRGWNFETASNSTEALQRIKNKPYELVITSLASSSDKDVELLRNMRRIRPHLKMIVLTEKNTPNAVLSSIRAHAFSYF